MGRRSKKIKYDPLLEEWMNDLIIEDEKTPRTVKNYAYNVNAFIEWIKGRGKALSEIHKKDLAKYLGELRGKGVSHSHIKSNYWAIRLWLEWMFEKGLFSKEELDRVHNFYLRRPKEEEIKTKALTEEQIKHITQSIHDDVKSMLFFVGINYGLRAEEMTNLEMQDVDLDAKMLYIRKGKGLRDRSIPILDDHIDIWLKWFETRKVCKQNYHTYVFFSSNGKLQIRNLQRYFKNMSKLAYPIPEHLLKDSLNDAEIQEFKKKNWFTSHDLRRTFATNLLRRGCNLNTIKKMLGHSNLATTSRYLCSKDKEADDDYCRALNGFK
ncbi:MAG: tyrosine-type recombinase/integrase [Candidatus Hodarchaeales archaeon]